MSRTSAESEQRRLKSATMTSNAEGGGVKVKDPSERGVCEQNLKFIDQSDNEEEDGRDFKVENLAPKSNGAGYSEVPQDTKRVCPYPDSADTACGFWIFRGPVLQKCVKIES